MADKVNKSLTLHDLPEYIDQHSEELITKSVFSPMSANLFKVQTGVKSKTALNLLDTAVTFGDGTVCGFTNNTSSTISQRYIVPGFIKVNAEYCDRDFLNTFAAHQVNVAAGRETLPFEEYFVEDIKRQIGKNLEIAIWQGDTTSANANLNKFDGLLKIMTADVPQANQQAKGADTILTRVWKVYNAIPEEVLFDEVIYLNNANFRALVKALVDLNMYHYERNIDESLDIILPGTNTHVKAINGLTGVDAVIALNPDHVVYGVDLEGDAETAKMWFSDDNDTFRLKIEFSVGVQIALPNEIIMNK
jgi:hypothetical protein